LSCSDRGCALSTRGAHPRRCTCAVFPKLCCYWSSLDLDLLNNRNVPCFKLDAPSLTRRRSRRAQINSVARMAKPIGMTTMAGPGRTISATPIATTVPPMTTTRILRSTRSGEVEVGGHSCTARLRLGFCTLGVDSRQGLAGAFDCLGDGTRNEGRRTINGGKRSGVCHHSLHASERA
jgi:hypothetical protein